MNITLITVGKIKEKYMVEGIKEYSKRISRYAKLKIIQVPDEKAPDDLTDKEMEIIKNKEGERILSKLPPNAYIISLVIEGKALDSNELARHMEELMIDGLSNVVFIIGGSLGLSDKIIKESNLKLSFSRMTFPHQLMRLILLEQIYRGFKIIRGEPYHK